MMSWFGLPNKSYWNYWVCLVVLYLAFLSAFHELSLKSHFKCKRLSVEFIENFSIKIKRPFSSQKIFLEIRFTSTFSWSFYVSSHWTDTFWYNPGKNRGSTALFYKTLVILSGFTRIAEVLISASKVFKYL